MDILSHEFMCNRTSLNRRHTLPWQEQSATLEVLTYSLTVSYLTRETCSVKKQDQAVTLYLLLSALLRFFLKVS